MQGSGRASTSAWQRTRRGGQRWLPGLVEETNRYLRMDGEKGGQVVRCSLSGAGTLAGITRWLYDGTEVPVSGRRPSPR